MKDTSATATLDSFLEEVCHGDPEIFGACFHDNAAVFGFEDGLFVRADRQTYLNFARLMRNQRRIKRTVEWRQLDGRIGSACIVENDGASKRVNYISIMQFEKRWKIICQTFEAKTEGAL